MATKVEKLPKSKVKIIVTPTKKDIKEATEKALHQLSLQIDIPGYRRGKAPVSMLRERVNDAKLALETLDVLTAEMFRKAISEHKLWPISDPKVNIPNQEKVYNDMLSPDKKSPKITIEYVVEIRPEIKLGDYKKIPVSKPSIMVQEIEVEKAIQNLFKEWKEQKKATSSQKIVTAQNLSEAEKKATEERKQNNESLAKIENDAPDDEWARFIGEKDLITLRTKVRTLLMDIKRGEAEKEFEQKIFDFLLSQASFEIPESLIKQQIEREEQQLRKQLAEAKIDFDDFLKQRNQNLEQVRQRWQKTIEKNLKIEFLLQQISKEQNITVSDKDVEAEIAQIENGNLRKQLEKPEQKEYIKYIMRQKRVVAWLKEKAGK